MVSKILHSRATGVETWITSDGRAYFVQLHESSGSETGTSDSGIAEEESSQVNQYIHTYLSIPH
jgi:hypothetical protein